ncbi:CDP-diacylglycerol--serine O-phosphatidyltransferase [Candidatus Woesearchaeota archaeon]|nr:CDP-diacylglycerol--serine O-phosphatidyltransferase [Candidatus Woesearchaeota archaeon]
MSLYMNLRKDIAVSDVFTLLNASFGMLSIFYAIRGEYFSAVVFMITAVIFDYLDGKIARKLNKTHEFGKELDSLADIISFGAAPAVFGYVYAGQALQGMWETVLAVSCIILVVCGALRLARFNITKAKGVYQGMPITLNGIIFPILYFAMLPAEYYFIVFLCSAGLMISPFRIKKIL